MSLTENSDQVFLPGGCNRTQNLRFGPYTTSPGSGDGGPRANICYHVAALLIIQDDNVLK